jgi:hypothetical protein
MMFVFQLSIVSLKVFNLVDILELQYNGGCSGGGGGGAIAQPLSHRSPLFLSKQSNSLRK